jgi:integrase
MPVRVLVRSKPDRAHLQLYYIDPHTGREVARSAGTADASEALKEAGRWEDELQQYRGDSDDGWRFFRDRFGDEHLATLAKKTQESFGTALNHYHRVMAPSRISDVTASALSVFQSKLLAENRKLTSISTYLRHIKTALNWAEDVGLIHKAPKMRMPRQGRRIFMRGRPLTEREYLSMREACSDVCGAEAEQWQRMLDLLWLSGLRLGEALRLRWDAPPVFVTLAMNPYPQLWFHAEGQKSRQDEAVPMTPDLAQWLEQTPPQARIGLVAPVRFQTRERVSEQISAIGKAAGVVVNDDDKAASAHDFRRSFGTRWARKVMPMTLQKLMRHADISTTLKYYVGLTSSDAGRELWGQSVPNDVPKASRKRQKTG